ncbi:MAG: signal peptidase I, partial [bacterium]|nr:signal peptidase I [bacterium]
MQEKTVNKENLEENTQPEQKEYGIFREYFELFCEVLMFVFFINAFLLQTYVIPSGSMEDTMLIGDHLLVNKVVYSRSYNIIDGFFLPQKKVSRGDIVTFTGPNEVNRDMTPKNLVKRVVALPGETVKVVRGIVYINGKRLDEPYVVFKDRLAFHSFPPGSEYGWYPEFPVRYRKFVVETKIGTAYKVPENHYFCMGDN